MFRQTKVYKVYIMIEIIWKYYTVNRIVKTEKLGFNNGKT